MALGSTFNTRDPRFQRALLKAGASSRGQRGLIKKITGDFAGEQLQKDLQFANIFDQHKHAQDVMGLKQRQLAFQGKMFGKKLRSEERGVTITTAAGLGTGVLSYIQGQRRAQLQRQDRLDTIAHRERLEAIGEKRPVIPAL